MIKRRKTRIVAVGNLKIGSGYPIVIQSMTKTNTCDVDSTTEQIQSLEKAGCELIRVAVKTAEDARAIKDIKKNINIPIAADIHFDYKLALEAINFGADKIRINPGNIVKKSHIRSVINCALENNIPIRVGINSGSFKKTKVLKQNPEHIMVDELLNYLENFRAEKFYNIIISIKSSDVVSTCGALKRIASRCDYPIHLGVTSTGLPEDGIVKSSVGIGALLLDGIGDTIRVSLTGESILEIETAKRILVASGTRYFAPEIISCPTCGRSQVDLISVAKELKRKLKKVKFDNLKNRNFTIAVMGCEVNGPGEAKNADIGIAFGKNRGAIFRKGKIVETVDVTIAVNRLIEMISENVTL
ncbi:MAG: flavodoxin-dependent (E)-4-hydroxy-3-methylbut-2-enyl-diphosphate synthase [Candidatus Omnitrophota bacterium]